MNKINKKDIAIFIIIILTLVVSLTVSFNDSVWQDEAYTMNILRKDFVGIVRTTAEDVHPPLYYFIAKIFTMCFGYSVPTVKLASIVPVILIMLFVWIKTKKLFKEKYATITIVFCLLIGFIPAAFVQNVELRMYTWAMFFVSCSGIFAYELYLNPKNKKILVMFVLTGILAAYTHYYAALTEGFIYLFLIINLIAKYKALKESLIIINLTIAFYLPWLPIFVNQFIVVKDYWWLNVFNWNSIVNIIRYPFNSMFTNTFLIITIVILIGMVVYLFKNKKDKEIWFALLCILSFALMVATGCTVSLLLRPVFTSRYTYTAIGLLFLGMSITVTKIDNGRLLKNLLIGVIILNFPFSYNLNYIREYKTGTEEFKRFAKNIREDITITTESNDIYHTLPYYLPNNELKWKYINGNTRGYVFSDETIEEMRELIPNATVEKLFSGDINGTMRFNVYYME
ncbi:MAG: hypothetical protein HFJ58_01705 [Clostridia bacterium]|nr:hypothetical protein [Clostridia bacterium]